MRRFYPRQHYPLLVDLSGFVVGLWVDVLLLHLLQPVAVRFGIQGLFNSFVSFFVRPEVWRLMNIALLVVVPVMLFMLLIQMIKRRRLL